MNTYSCAASTQSLQTIKKSFIVFHYMLFYIYFYFIRIDNIANADFDEYNTLEIHILLTIEYHIIIGTSFEFLSGKKRF